MSSMGHKCDRIPIAPNSTTWFNVAIALIHTNIVSLTVQDTDSLRTVSSSYGSLDDALGLAQGVVYLSWLA